MADNAEHNVVDELTDGVVEDECDRIISQGVNVEFNIVTIVEIETLGIVSTVAIDGVIEEEDVEAETRDVVEVIEIAGEEETIAIVEAINVLGDDGLARTK